VEFYKDPLLSHCAGHIGGIENSLTISSKCGFPGSPPDVTVREELRNSPIIPFDAVEDGLSSLPSARMLCGIQFNSERVCKDMDWRAVSLWYIFRMVTISMFLISNFITFFARYIGPKQFEVYNCCGQNNRV